MRGTPRTDLLAFSLLCLLLKVRGPWALKHTTGFLGVMGVGTPGRTPGPPALGTARLPSLVPRQLPLSSSVCYVTLWMSLLPSEPQLLPWLNGHGVHKAFVKVIYENSSDMLRTWHVAKVQKRTFIILIYPHEPSTKALHK